MNKIVYLSLLIIVFSCQENTKEENVSFQEDINEFKKVYIEKKNPVYVSKRNDTLFWGINSSNQDKLLKNNVLLNDSTPLVYHKNILNDMYVYLLKHDTFFLEMDTITYYFRAGNDTEIKIDTNQYKKSLIIENVTIEFCAGYGMYPSFFTVCNIYKKELNLNFFLGTHIICINASTIEYGKEYTGSLEYYKSGDILESNERNIRLNNFVFRPYENQIAQP